MSRKEHVELICSIAEQASLFEKTNSLDGFLQSAAETIAGHMHAAVCSIYLYDDSTKELELRASRGLRSEAIGAVRLALGEGITGLALKELRPICEGRAASSDAYKFFPGIDEELYEAFLAVPIVRGLVRIGVLVVQDPQPDYFDAHDVRALRAIAAQFAMAIENTKLFLELSKPGADIPSQPVHTLKEGSFLVRGTSASEGVAIGHVLRWEDAGETDAVDLCEEGCDVDALQGALAHTESQLEQLQAKLERDHADVAGMIFSAHLLMLKDSSFSGSIIEAVQNGKGPVQAVQDVVHRFVDLFSKSSNPRLQEKVQDVRDVGYRLLRNLGCRDQVDLNYDGTVVMASDLLPSDMVRLAAQEVEGVLLRSGGVTAHVAILARSFQLPVIVSDDPVLEAVADGTQLILDGYQGTIIIQPDKEAIRSYEELRGSREKAVEDGAADDGPVATADGTRIRVLANVNLLSELRLVDELHAEGIGLYRSEFPFIVRNDFPSEEEQMRIYSALAERMNGRPVVFRTLDIGGDKMLSYFPNASESNPFLGLRAIRFSLQYMDIFKQQLRAILRANAGRTAYILFPLISSIDDFTNARNVVHACIDELAAEHESFAAEVKLGCMIELPSIIELAEELAEECDFMSIGTNDLVQYILAVDRTNENVSSMYVEHHPAVLRALNRLVKKVAPYDCNVSICGELVTKPGMLPFLLGIGIRTFSVDPRYVPRLRRAVRAVRMNECVERAQAMLQIGRIDRMEAFLNAL